VVVPGLGGTGYPRSVTANVSCWLPLLSAGRRGSYLGYKPSIAFAATESIQRQSRGGLRVAPLVFRSSPALRQMSRPAQIIVDATLPARSLAAIKLHHIRIEAQANGLLRVL
jgi:hypothetical protein